MRSSVNTQVLDLRIGSKMPVTEIERDLMQMKACKENHL